MKKLKIFPKTFLYTLSLMLVIVLLSHILIYVLMPKVYNYRQKKALEADVCLLVQKVMDAPSDQRLSCVADFAGKWASNISVAYDGFAYDIGMFGEQADTEFSRSGRVKATIITESSDTGLKISLAGNPQGGADVFQINQTFAGGRGSISAVVSRKQIEDAVSVILMILPFTFILCTAISVVSALIFSKMFTKPIRQISAVTERMQKLEPDVCCMADSQDEIGILADSINSLYQNLLKTIRELEHGIRKVEEADVQKTNFLRAASHELKTPVAAVNAMLENMLLGVGKYKDRDTYLAKCKHLIEQLSGMIREILDASKMQFDQKQPSVEFDLADAVGTLLEPYQIIARAKGIRMDVGMEEPLILKYPRDAVEKVVSNLLSNAVSYTKGGRTIHVYFDGHMLVVENECPVIMPEHLSHIFEPFYRPDYGRGREAGGNGLGLYIVASILDSLAVKYQFVPSENIDGMAFKINF